MKIKLLFFLFFLVFMIQDLLAQPYDMISVSDPVLEDLRYLALVSGRPFLSFTPPLSPHEIEQFLDSLDNTNLPLPAQEAYQRARKRLTPEANITFARKNFQFLLNIDSTIEIKTRLNTDITWYPQYPDIPAFLTFPFRLSFVNIFQLYFEPGINVNSQYYNNTEYFGINLPYDFSYFDKTFPLKAYLAAGGSWWNVQLGRDRIFWGTGQTGSLSFADNSKFFEFFRFSAFTDIFKYSLMVNQMPLRVTEYLFSDQELLASFPYNFMHTTQRHFYLHRIDATFFSRVTLSLMEGIMSANSGLELRFLNPFVIFHSFFAWEDYEGWLIPRNGSMIGSFFSAEVNWNIVRNLAFHGQFVMNQFALPSEIASGNQEPPNALGYLAGLHFTHSFKTWGSVFFVEFIYTDPYCYILSSPFASFIQMIRIADNQEEYYYIGYPRDTMVLTVGTRFFQDNALSIAGSFSWISSGEHNKDGITWDWNNDQDAFNEKTPSGIAENKLIASFSVQWNVLSFLSLSGNITGIYSMNNKHNSGSNEAGLQARVSVNFRY